MDWKVRFIDFPAQFRALESEIMDTIQDTLAGGDLIMRRQLESFETNLAAFVGTRHAIGVSNCTDAIRLVLMALGIGPGDEVISVGHTFVASISPIHFVGATPVLIDVGDDHNMDVSLLEAAITERTRAIIPVDLNGRMCDMGRLMAVADKHGLAVLEDSAQALGASFDGTRGGAFGVAGVFSFYPAKLLGAFGDGGAVTTNDHGIAEKVRLLRDHGRMTKNDLSGWAYNCRLDNLQAALLDLKLGYLPAWIDRRRELATLYDKTLEGIAEIRRPAAPTSDGPYFDVFQNYVIEAQRRDELASSLTAAGMETIISWPKPMHHQETLGLKHFDLPRTEALCASVISLPLTPEIEDEQVSYVADAIRSFYRS